MNSSPSSFTLLLLYLLSIRQQAYRVTKTVYENFTKDQGAGMLAVQCSLTQLTKVRRVKLAVVSVLAPAVEPVAGCLSSGRSAAGLQLGGGDN